MARVWGGRVAPHRDPAPFRIRTSVGWRTAYVCSLCGCFVLAEDEAGVRHLVFHEQIGTLGRPDEADQE